MMYVTCQISYVNPSPVIQSRYATVTNPKTDPSSKRSEVNDFWRLFGSCSSTFRPFHFSRLVELKGELKGFEGSKGQTKGI